MRELSVQEIENISGAGLFAILGEAIGSAIGSIVDAGTAAGGLSTDAVSGAAKLGNGIGSILDLDIISAITNMGTGIAGIVAFGIDAISQIKANSTTVDA
ncbi:hypothetical protein EH228_09120 [Erwinia endophytica]|uniref:hypothetical protein n=1 Tax=Erwinia endophytica TaxID=1563158 RepID=UPI001265F46B|nr:hypothetical protein [Erwinia endophytica]KAB8311868.1 hypothetical protein EH228_09120 [Erwinia endophytica]